jgi:UrcA family protein
MRNAIICSAIALAAIGLGAAAPAQARHAEKAIHYGDLDLSRPDDATTLRHRIARALETVCGSYATVEPSQTDTIDRCRADARQRADTELARVMNDASNRHLAAK